MSIRTWQIADPEMPSESVTSGGTSELGFVHRRLKGGLREGVDLIEVHCGRLRFSIIPTRGMGIWKASWDQIEFGWRSPVAGPVHPSFVTLCDPSGLGWLDGFDELLARCGLQSNGAPDFDATGRLRYPLHGRIANTPAQRFDVHIDDQEKTLEVRGTVLESRFHFQKLELSTVYRCQLHRPSILIQDEITNRSSVPATCQLLYHFNFGPPVLDEGAKIVAPIREIAPRDVVAANAIDTWDVCPPPKSGHPEQVFFLKLQTDAHHQTSTLLHNSSQDIGVVLSYDDRQLPCFTLWKNVTSLQDGFVFGLEPATNYPNVRSFEEKNDRVVKLAAEESYKIQVELAFCCGKQAVIDEVRRIQALQTIAPHRLIWPSPNYSPIDEDTSNI